jgi:hypothetical protein
VVCHVKWVLLQITCEYCPFRRQCRAWAQDECARYTGQKWAARRGHQAERGVDGDELEVHLAERDGLVRDVGQVLRPVSAG